MVKRAAILLILMLVLVSLVQAQVTDLVVGHPTQLYVEQEGTYIAQYFDISELPGFPLTPTEHNASCFYLYNSSLFSFDYNLTAQQFELSAGYPSIGNHSFSVYCNATGFDSQSMENLTQEVLPTPSGPGPSLLTLISVPTPGVLYVGQEISNNIIFESYFDENGSQNYYRLNPTDHNASCIVEITDEIEESTDIVGTLPFDHETETFYYYNTYIQIGNYTETFTCSAPGYETISSPTNREVLPAPTYIHANNYYVNSESVTLSAYYVNSITGKKISNSGVVTTCGARIYNNDTSEPTFGDSVIELVYNNESEAFEATAQLSEIETYYWSVSCGGNPNFENAELLRAGEFYIEDPVQCASTEISSDTMLLENKICSNDGGAPLFTIAADNVTLDCNGATLRGIGSNSGRMAIISTVASDVSIVNCNVDGFSWPLWAFISNNVSFRNISVANSGNSINVVSSNNTVIDNFTFSNGVIDYAPAIWISDSENTSLSNGLFQNYTVALTAFNSNNFNISNITANTTNTVVQIFDSNHVSIRGLATYGSSLGMQLVNTNNSQVEDFSFANGVYDEYAPEMTTPIGIMALNADNISILNLTASNASMAVLLVNTSNSIVKGFSFTDSFSSNETTALVIVENSSNNIVENGVVSNYSMGAAIVNGSNNTIRNVNLTNTTVGVAVLANETTVQNLLFNFTSSALLAMSSNNLFENILIYNSLDENKEEPTVGIATNSSSFNGITVFNSMHDAVWLGGINNSILIAINNINGTALTLLEGSANNSINFTELANNVLDLNITDYTNSVYGNVFHGNFTSAFFNVTNSSQWQEVALFYGVSLNANNTFIHYNKLALYNDTGVVNITNLANTFTLANNTVSLNSTQIPFLNVRATITFAEILYENMLVYEVLRDGAPCSEPNCTKLSASPVSFEVIGFSNYSTRAFAPTSPASPSNPSSQSSSSSGGASSTTIAVAQVNKTASKTRSTTSAATPRVETNAGGEEAVEEDAGTIEEVSSTTSQEAAPRAVTGLITGIPQEQVAIGAGIILFAILTLVYMYFLKK